MEMMRSVYPHDQVFGEYCTVNDYIDCPPDELFEYLADTRSLEEWTYSLRGSRPPTNPGCGWPTTGSARRPRSTPAPSPTRDARTVDYHCAWDQGKHLWMIYLMRVVDAQVVLDKPGRSCCGPTATTRSTTTTRIRRPRRRKRPVWVGDFWDMFGAGHLLELKNLKAIAEYRHRNGLPVTPAWMR